MSGPELAARPGRPGLQWLDMDFAAEQPRRFVFLILAAWAVVHLVLAALVATEIQGGDSIYYLVISENIAHHGVHGLGPTQPTFYRAPLYPASIAWTAWLPFDRIHTILFFHSVLTAITAVSVFLMLRKRWPRLACFGSLLIAASPFATLMDYRVLAESLYTALMTLVGVYAFTRLGRLGLKGGALIGLGLGLLALTRESFILLPVAYAFAFLVLTPPTEWRRLVRPLVTLLVVFAAVVTPWMARNAALPEGGFFLSRGTFGINLWIGAWQRWEPWKPLPAHAFDNPEQRARLTAALERRDDDVLKAAAIERLRERPLETVSTWLIRAPRMWVGTRAELTNLRLPHGSLSWTVVKAGLFALNAGLLALAAFGIAIGFLYDRRYLMFGVPIGYLVLIYLPFHNSEPRYSSAAVPLLILFATVGLLWAWDRFRASRAVKPAEPCGEPAPVSSEKIAS